MILQFLEEVSPLVHFVYSFLLAWIFGALSIKLLKKVHRKMKFTNFNVWPNSKQTLNGHRRKSREVKVVLSCFLQQDEDVELHMI